MFRDESRGSSITQGLCATECLRGVLGPLLFLAYVDDMTHGMKNPYLMFADEFKLLETENTPKGSRSRLLVVGKMRSSAQLETVPETGRGCKLISPHGSTWTTDRHGTNIARERTRYISEGVLQLWSEAPKTGQESTACLAPS